jgi:ribose 5-phosphate isomerase B
MTPAESFETIHLATDHAGLERKEEVKAWLTEAGYRVVDHGAHEFDALDDFPDCITPAAKAVSAAPALTRAIIFGGSGNGEAIIANRYPGVRAAVYYGGDLSIVRLSREHNDANILSIGARFVGADEALEAVSVWLSTKVDPDEKYTRRNQKIEVYTKAIRNL